VTSTITGTASVNVVAPAPATHFGVSAPASTTAGASFSITITALDANNNTAPSYHGTIHFTSSDTRSGVALPADYTFVAADNGVHTFTNGVTLVSAGSQSVTATDTTSTSITGSATVTVNPAAASTLIVAGFPSPISAGTAGSFTVTAKDAYGNTATGYAGTVHFTSSDAQATLPANSTLTSGTRSFSATLKSAGTQSLTVTDTLTSSITGTQTGITVNPAAASILVVAGFPSPVTAGIAGSFTVTAKDPYGNTATSYAGTVHFTSSDGQAVLPTNSMLTNGTGAFSATLKTAGTQSITATDSVTTSITGSQTGITINPAAASTLVVAGFASPVTAGTSGSFTVTAKDPYSNTATGYAGTVHFMSTDGQATLPADSTLPNGTGSFSATLRTVGTQSITATDTVTASITGTQSGINVTGPTADLSVSVSGPATANEGDTVTYNLTVSNAGPSSASAVTLTDTLPSILTFRSATTSQGTFSASGGVVTFTPGTIAAGATVTATVTALAIEDGTGSDAASVTSSTPDPTTADNSASTTTSFAEPPIIVSGAIRVKTPSVTNLQVATFTHANGVEPTSAFAATIDWGDGTSSSGTITLSGTTYTVTGSHFYGNNGYHTISTSVKESGNSPFGGDKVGNDRPGGDVVHLTQDSAIHGEQNAFSAHAPVMTPTISEGASFLVTVTPVVPQPGPANTATGSAARLGNPVFAPRVMELFFVADVQSLVESLQTPKRSEAPADWFSEAWLADAWLINLEV
jgi:uncharacterized repeat protein (TIGR01451 family)